MRKLLGVVLAVVFLWCSVAMANPEIRALRITPFNLVVQDGEVVQVPYEGMAEYSGSVPFSGLASFEGETPFSGSIGYEGMVPFTYEIPDTYIYAYEECLEWVADVPSCPTQGKKENCCTTQQQGDDGTYHMVCYKVDPSVFWNHYCYPVYTATEGQVITVDVPYSGTVNYSGMAPYSGEVRYSGSQAYSGAVGYSGVVEWTEAGSEFPQPVTVAKVGDKLSGIHVVGYTFGLNTVDYRVIVYYLAPGDVWPDNKTVVLKTDVTKVAVDGEFSDNVGSGFTFDKVGYYVFRFKIWKPDGTIGGVKTKTVAIEGGSK